MFGKKKHKEAQHNATAGFNIMLGGPKSGGDEYAKKHLEKSKLCYQRMTDDNGRFSYFECNDKLFPSAHPIQSRYITETSDQLSDVSKFYQDQGHLLLIGEGGIGKTTSLLKAWKDLLENYEQYRIIPFYIPLNEANSVSLTNFIESYLQETYDVNISEISDRRIDFTIMFLLDGFNEISDRLNQVEISKEIKRYCKKPNFRLIMTSRFDFSNMFLLENVQRYNILPLDENIIREYLKSENITQTEIPYSVIANPMMLTLFANMCKIKESISESISLPFTENNSKGELLSNFVFCQIGKGFSFEKISNAYHLYIALLVVSPYIAHMIETQGIFVFSLSKIRDYVKEAIENCSEEKMRFLFGRDLFSLSGYEPFLWDGKQEMVTTIVKILLEDLAIMQADGQYVSFRHQHFRDFFSAWFILNDAVISAEKAQIPPTLSTRILPDYIACFIGDCTHDYQNTNKMDESNVLYRLTKLLVGNSSNEAQLLLNNIVNIQKIARNNNMSTADLSGQDLTGIPLSGIIFSHGHYCADFGGAKLSSRTFLPQGHMGQVRSAVYSKNDRIILSSGDTSVKEWDSFTGLSIATYSGHTNLVNSACFHPDEMKILSAGNDNMVREWDRKTGKCLHVFADHKGYVTKAIYDKTGDRVFSCSWDGCVFMYKREGNGWSAPKTVAKHDMNVKSISLSADGNFILTGSGDGSVREWMVDGALVHTYLGHRDMVNSVSYSPSDKYVLSGGYDKSFIVFDRQTEKKLFEIGLDNWVRNIIFDGSEQSIIVAVHDGSILEYSFSAGKGCQFISKYIGHTKAVTNVSVSSDRAKIVSTSEDGTIREWDRKGCQCIRVYEGIDFSMTDTVYSSDGLSVLTIKDFEFTVAKRTDGIPYFHSGKFEHAISSAVFAQDDNTILYTNADGLFLRRIDREQPECLIDSATEHCTLQYAKYDKAGSRIIAIGITKTSSTVVYYIDSANNCKKYILPVSAELADFQSATEFVTFSSGGVIRIWSLDNGAQLGVYGVNIHGCNFRGCDFSGEMIKQVIEEAGGIT